MNLITKRTLVSKIDPTISYEARSFSEARRMALQASITDATYKLYDLFNRADALLPEVKTETVSQEIINKRTAVMIEINSLTGTTIHPAWVRAYLIKVKGLQIDGVDATVESFISDAPSDLFNELVVMIKDEAELSVDASKNS